MFRTSNVLIFSMCSDSKRSLLQRSASIVSAMFRARTSSAFCNKWWRNRQTEATFFSYGELGRGEQFATMRLLLFQNLWKRYLACRRRGILQARYPLWIKAKLISDLKKILKTCYMSEWLLCNTMCSVFSLYYDENKLYFKREDNDVRFILY